MVRAAWYACFVVVALIVLASPQGVRAHGSGSSWNASVGMYTVDVGYDPETLQVGRATRFDFLLWEGSAGAGTQAAYEQAWVRIVREGQATVLATGIWHQSIGPTTLLYQFDRSGEYTLEVAFRDADGKDIAAASFPIAVDAASDGAPGNKRALLAALLCGIIGGVVVHALLHRFRART